MLRAAVRALVSLAVLLCLVPSVSLILLLVVLYFYGQINDDDPFCECNAVALYVFKDNVFAAQRLAVILSVHAI